MGSQRFGEHEEAVETAIALVLLNAQTKMGLDRNESINIVRGAMEESLNKALVRTDPQVAAYVANAAVEKAPDPVITNTTLPKKEKEDRGWPGRK